MRSKNTQWNDKNNKKKSSKNNFNFFHSSLYIYIYKFFFLHIFYIFLASTNNPVMGITRSHNSSKFKNEFLNFVLKHVFEKVNMIKSNYFTRFINIKENKNTTLCRNITASMQWRKASSHASQALPQTLLLTRNTTVQETRPSQRRLWLHSSSLLPHL